MMIDETASIASLVSVFDGVPLQWLHSCARTEGLRVRNRTINGPSGWSRAGMRPATPAAERRCFGLHPSPRCPSSVPTDSSAASLARDCRSTRPLANQLAGITVKQRCRLHAAITGQGGNLPEWLIILRLR
jgi:hypothetical protein